MMIAMEGPDRCGKSEISKALALQLQHSYFKNSGEWDIDVRSKEYFKNILTYGAPLMTELLCQIKPSVVLDRYYPSEWVYSKVFGRSSDEKLITKIDHRFAEAGGRIILCRRKNYAGLKDDLHEHIDSNILKQLDACYEQFALWTRCPVLTLWVDDEDLERELNDITEWLNQQ